MMKIIKENLLIYKIKIYAPFIILGENYIYKKLSQILNGEEDLIKKNNIYPGIIDKIIIE